MKASVYNERSEKTQKFASVEKALKYLSDVVEISENDPMCINEFKVEFRGVEDNCAYFNLV